MASQKKTPPKKQKNWRIPESLEKVIPILRFLYPHLQWRLQENNVLTGQPLHPIKHALQSLQMHQKRGGVLA